MAARLKRAQEFNLTTIDCVEGMKKLAPQSVDVVVTSPPYNIGMEYGSHDDNMEHAAYLGWCAKWAAGIHNALKADGSFFLNIGAVSSKPFFPFEVATVMKDAGFVLQNTIHWIKSITVETRKGGQFSIGHFKPINSQRFLNDCQEYVFHFTKAGNTAINRLAVGVPYADKTNIARWGHTNGKDLRCRGNTWFIPYKTITGRAKDRPHPATFPTELAVKCIRLHGKQQAVVMDPFLGIGHAALAAMECGPILVSKFIGFDVDAEYVKIARELVERDYPPVSRKTHRKPQQVAA